ncbi:MAG: class I SAM-dependent rRNA methyltransferase [Parachlamydia sp.]|nr:class I SAM-dependent rRNA methyltransferase [Parachlamydia sp.]
MPVILKPQKEKPLKNRHHWIFSGAVQSFPPFDDGQFLPIQSSEGLFLGYGYFNRRSSIVGRVVSFDQTPPLESIGERILAAQRFRKTLFSHSETNGYRLIHGEGDGIPGLTLDVYDDILVLQIATKGIDCIKDWLVNFLNDHFKPRAIYEKSLLPSRKEEGLKETQGFLSGGETSEVTFQENGLLFKTSLIRSQKTGFFFDQREMRNWVRTLAAGKRVLNAFSYTGGFSVYALAGGAVQVDSMDISKEAIQGAEENVVLNGFHQGHQGIAADAFSFLRERPLPYDIVILDPPAFAKRKTDVVAACRGYKDINRLAMQKMPPGSLLLTCSCSHHVDEELFQKVLFQAAVEAKREVRVVGKHRLASDHPINIFHPESNYLKSLLLYIE